MKTYNYVLLIMTFFRKTLWRLLFPFFCWLSSRLKEAEKDNLPRTLKSCGVNCSFKMPIHIDGPESVEMGDQVSIAPFVHIWGQGGLKIGNRVMIASHTAITTLTHDYNQKIMFMSLVQNAVTIEDDVWIGSHSVIMPGITIGKGSVIGAGSVVTKDVAPYSIAMGVPARHIRFRECKDALC